MYKRKCGGQHMRKILLLLACIVALGGCQNTDKNLEKALASFRQDFDTYEYRYITKDLIYIKTYRTDIYGTARIFIYEYVYDCTNGNWRPLILQHYA